jgi:multidrug efflux pump subunit AcrB
MSRVLPKFLEEATKSPLLRFVDVDLKVNRPAGVITINRRKAAELGVSVEEIARALQLAYSARRASATSSRTASSTRSSARCSARTATSPATSSACT